jgi:hypothetical protein
VAVDLLLELPARIELRELARDRGDEAEAERDRPQQPEDEDECEEPALADPAPPWPVLSFQAQGASVAPGFQALAAEITASTSSA